jgi:SAM-dependent methyltransferase
MRSLIHSLVSFNKKLTEIIDRQFPRFVKKESYHKQLLFFADKIVNERSFCSVLEVGGTDRPLLNRSSKFRYDGLDIEYKAQCEKIYDNFYVQSIEQPIENKYDLILSMTLLEHVKNNDVCFRQIYSALKPGGYSIHYFPSKYHPYSILLRLIDPKWQNKLIRILRPWAVSVTGYPAFFDKCCPGDMRILCKQCGFQNIRIIPFFRANDYFRFCFPCYIAITFWENICRRFELEQLCSGLVIVMEKPKERQRS